jgi:DNA-binding transcriptional LysR family regulator
MDSRLLNSFVVTAELGNVTSAARRLHMTQSALSRQIRQLEDDLGVQLFERLGKKIRVSPDGHALLSRIEEVLAAHRNLEGTAENLRNQESAVLRIGACSQLIERYFAGFLTLWKRSHPTIEIRLEEGGGVELNDKLMAGDVRLVINAGTARQPDSTDVVALGRVMVLAVGTAAFLGDSTDPIEIQDVCRHPLLLLNKNHVSRGIFDSASRLTVPYPVVVLESGSPHTLFPLAEGGIGVAVVPSCIRAPASHLVVRPVAINKRVLDFEICAMWSKKMPLPEYAKRFVTLLGEYIATQSSAPETDAVNAGKIETTGVESYRRGAAASTISNVIDMVRSRN